MFLDKNFEVVKVAREEQIVHEKKVDVLLSVCEKIGKESEII